MKSSVFQNLYRKLLNHPKYRWLIIVGSAFYLLSPLDISPDIFPIVGWIDDGAIATLLAAEITQIILDRRQNIKQKSSEEPTSTEQPSETETVTSQK
ncbi:MAG: YkvA family protein [Microcoleaceae cyanobacterium]